MSDGYEQTLEQLAAALQVRHVAHRPLTTVPAESTPKAAERDAKRLTLNNLPVVARDGGIIGVLENLNGEIDEYDRPRQDVPAVRFSMRPLSDRMLVESQRSIEGLFEDLLAAPYYQLVVTAGRIDGIVTASDLNKAPVRVMAYATVAHLETAMTAAIRKTCADDEAAVLKLGQGGAAQVRRAHGRLLAGNLNSALLDATTFKQKGIILAGLNVFKTADGKSVAAEFEDLYQRLRNPVMHMSEFVADSIDGLRGFAGALSCVRRRTGEALAAAV